MRPLNFDELETELREAVDADADAGTFDRIAAAFDRLEVTTDPPSLAAAAVWYARQGLHIFPLQPVSKVPYKGSRGCKDATDDLGQVHAWWTARPDSNIAIATGHLVDVIDIDGPEGNCSIAKVDNLPRILGAVSTPRPGGRHLYVAATGRGNRARVMPGVDHRGAGGYVVAPPSVNQQGRYLWVSDLHLE